MLDSQYGLPVPTGAPASSYLPLNAAKAALDQAWDPIVVLRAVRNGVDEIVDFEYVEANAVACRLNGQPYDALIGSRLLSLLPTHEGNGLFGLYCGVVQTQTPLDIADLPFDAGALDGSVHRIDLHAEPLGDGLIVTWRDVTALHTAREQANASDTMRRHSLEVLFDPHVVLDAVRDAKGAIVDFGIADANSAAAAYAGLTTSDVRGRTVLGVVREMGDDGRLDEFFAALVDAVETQRATMIENLSPVVPGGAGDVYVDVRIAPIRDQVMVAWRDVTPWVRATQSLAASERRFRTLAENSLDVVYETDGRGLITWVSPSVQQLLGWAPAKLLGMAATMLVHPEDQHLAAESTRRILAGEQTVRSELRYLRVDGGPVWVSSVVSAIRTTGSAPSGAVVSLRGVDELVHERERAHGGEAVLHSVIGAMLDAIAVLAVETDESGRVTDFLIEEMNVAAIEHTHLDARDLTGRPIGALIPAAADAQLRTLLTRAFESGTAVIERGMALAPSGDPDRDLLFDVTAVRVGERVTLTWRNVTEQQRAVRALARSEERFRLLADHSSDVVVLMDPDGAMGWVSPASTETLGWHPEDLVGTHSLDYLHKDDVARARSAIERSELTGESSKGRFRWRRPDGSFIWVEAAGRPIVDADGRHGRVVRLRDVQREVEAEDELATNEARFRMLAENASDLVYQADENGRIAWISPSVTPMLGWEPQALVGKVATEFVAPEDLPRVQFLRPGMYSGADVTSLILRVRTASGELRWVSLSSRPLREPLGMSHGAIISIRDVHNLVLSNQQAELAARQLRANADAMIDPFVTLSSLRDDDDRIVDFAYVDANRAARTMMARHGEALTGLTLLQTTTGAVTTGLLAMLAETVETGRPTVLEDWAYPADDEGPVRWFDMAATKLGDGVTMSWRDVTVRFETSRALIESEERLRLVLANVTDVVLRVRRDVIDWISPSVAAAFGGRVEDYLGAHIEHWIHPDDLADMSALDSVSIRDRSVVRRVRVCDDAGDYHWVEAHLSAYIDSTGRTDGVIGALRIVDDQVAAEAELERRARWDALTGLLSRGEVMSRLSQRLEGMRRSGGQLALAFCDLDDFKAINDTFGHAVGDALLEEVSRRVRDSVREVDLVARLGGDEILVVLDGQHSLEDAATVGEKVRSAVAAPVSLSGADVRTSMSIGVTLARPGEGLDDLLARADDAMYQAKRSGRNRVMAIA